MNTFGLHDKPLESDSLVNHESVAAHTKAKSKVTSFAPGCLADATHRWSLVKLARVARPGETGPGLPNGFQGNLLRPACGKWFTGDSPAASACVRRPLVSMLRSVSRWMRPEDLLRLTFLGT